MAEKQVASVAPKYEDQGTERIGGTATSPMQSHVRLQIAAVHVPDSRISSSTGCRVEDLRCGRAKSNGTWVSQGSLLHCFFCASNPRAADHAPCGIPSPVWPGRDKSQGPGGLAGGVQYCSWIRCRGSARRCWSGRAWRLSMPGGSMRQVGVGQIPAAGGVEGPGGD